MKTCKFEMSDGQPCGRPVYTTEQAISTGRCVLHLDDADKPPGHCKEALASIEPDAMGILDFAGMVFPRSGDLGFADKVFRSEADFSGAMFHGSANFSRARFLEYANFSQCVFHNTAMFSEARFQGNANFHGAHFQAVSYFREGTFGGTANFVEVRANGNLHCQKARFLGEVHFSDADLNGLFLQEAIFKGSNEVDLTVKSMGSSPLQLRGALVDAKLRAEDTRLADVDLSGATFFCSALLRQVVFEGHLRMVSTQFHRAADFRFCHFQGPVVASGARFAGARFFRATFDSSLSMHGTAFVGGASPAIADFREVTFRHPSKAHFVRINEDEVTGARFRFHNTYLDRLQFESVNWFLTQKKWYRPGRLTLQDELDVREASRGGSTQPGLTPDTAATIYHRLLKNFELVRSFGLAEDCFCGSMDLRLLDKSKPWLERCFIRGYRGASYYGSSYAQALFVLLALLVGFGLIFSGVGLAPATTEVQLSPAPNAALAAIANGFFHSFQIATFQETLFHSESPSLRLVEGFMRILLASQVALFLLALRRRFRR